MEELYIEVNDGTIGDKRENWERNKNLVDLSCIPEEYEEKIIEAYNAEHNTKRDKLLNYFIEKKLKNLMEHIGEF